MARVLVNFFVSVFHYNICTYHPLLAVVHWCCCLQSNKQNIEVVDTVHAKLCRYLIHYLPAINVLTLPLCQAVQLFDLLSIHNKCSYISLMPSCAGLNILNILWSTIYL